MDALKPSLAGRDPDPTRPLEQRIHGTPAVLRHASVCADARRRESL